MLKDRIKTHMLEAMKAGRAVEKDVLRVALGEIQSLEAREGRPAKDEEVERMLRKLVKSGEESREATSDEARRARLAEENEILSGFLPKTLTPDEIVQALGPVRQALLEAPGDGPAMGIAMKHLQGAGESVEGGDVRVAVQRIRSEGEGNGS